MAPAIVELGLVLVVLWTSGLRTVSGLTLVTHLPGFDGRLPFELETGYIAVDELEEVNLFYYFVKSERSPAEDPLLLWVTGGPGCTGLTGLAYEFLTKTYETRRLPSLIYREESWTRISSIIFVDSPVGTGFSYSKAAEENEWSDTKTSRRLGVFIRKWLVDHPEFISNPFYIAGDSYGGKLCPIVAQEVINGNEAGAKPLGYLVGNPVTSEGRFDMGSKIPYSHGVGFISDELYEATKASCGGDYVTPRSVQCAKCLEAVADNLKALNVECTLEPLCVWSSPEPKHSPREGRSLGEVERPHPLSLQILRDRSSPFGDLPAKSWANSDAVREALGVRKGWTGDWVRCRGDIRTNRTIDIPSAVPYHLNVTRRGFRALVYSGDHDLFVNFLGTQAWLRSLNYSIVHDWRPWLVNGQAAGYTRTYANNLTFATVKGAGHIATEYKPRECWDMFERWISGQAL
ncbi:unnamed protein product [Spirodela intermedia]|uniref:Uncharacterized protein n=1 Tax=Spirodela intermedia TaxID=51605 RepID=A0A7I8KA07_SPIIN|nr:unnamed protein product [Spirodela intermedia]